jgi:hypothetical protein
LITAHLPESRRDTKLLVEFEYRAGQTLTTAPATAASVWELIRSAEVEERAVVRALAAVTAKRGANIPIRLPLTLPELPTTERIVGVDLVHDEPPEHSYTLSVAYLPDKSYSLVVAFAETVSTLAEGIPVLVDLAAGVLRGVLREQKK